MNVPTFYYDVLQTLEERECHYVIVGGFAAAAYGSRRATYDIDIIVDLDEEDIEALARRYPAPRYYADPKQMRDSIDRGIMFNLIDTDTGEKVDLVPLSMDTRYRRALEHRIRRAYRDPSGRQMEAWYAPPEDVITGKLMAWAESQSRRHEDDIYSMLVFIYMEADPAVTAAFQETRVDAFAVSLGSDVAELWKDLKSAAKEDAQTE